MDQVFIEHMVNLLCLDDLVFAEDLKRDEPACFLIFGYLNLAKASLPDDAADLVILELHFPDSSFLFLHLHQIENYIRLQKLLISII